MANSRGECLADLPASVQRGMRNVPHPVRANLGNSEYGGHMEGMVGSEERDGYVRPGYPLGPGTKVREGGSGSPRALVPLAAGSSDCPGPPRTAPPVQSLWAGTQAQTSRRSQERGLGQTQSLRSRSNVAVQQVLGTPSGHGQAHGLQLTHQGTSMYSHRCGLTTTRP